MLNVPLLKRRCVIGFFVKLFVLNYIYFYFYQASGKKLKIDEAAEDGKAPVDPAL